MRGSVGKNAAALSGADTVGSVLAQKTDGLEQQLDGLLTRAAELASLRERLNQVDELSSRTGAQVDALQKSRADLETFHEEIHAFHTSRAEIMGAAEQLAADRTAFEGFVQRVDDFQKRLPGLESKMDAITAKAAVVDEQTKRVSTLVAMSDDLDLQVTRIEGHKQDVEKIAARLNTLNSLSDDVDRKLEQRLTEVDSLKKRLEELSIQMAAARLQMSTSADRFKNETDGATPGSCRDVDTRAQPAEETGLGSGSGRDARQSRRSQGSDTRA